MSGEFPQSDQDLVVPSVPHNADAPYKGAAEVSANTVADALLRKPDASPAAPVLEMFFSKEELDSLRERAKSNLREKVSELSEAEKVIDMPAFAEAMKAVLRVANEAGSPSNTEVSHTADYQTKQETQS